MENTTKELPLHSVSRLIWKEGSGEIIRSASPDHTAWFAQKKKKITERRQLLNKLFLIYAVQQDTQSDFNE